MKQLLFRIWLVSAMTSLAALLIMQRDAMSASYRVFFNNVEQSGQNLTAKPTLNVGSDGTVSKSDGENAADPVALNPTIAATEADVGKHINEPSQFGLGTVRMTLGAHALIQKRIHLKDCPSCSVDDPKAQGGLNFALDLDLGKHVTLSAFGGLYSLNKGDLDGVNLKPFLGADLDVYVFRSRLLDVGLLAGAATFRTDEWSPITPHGGARVNLNLTRNFSVSTVGRIGSDYRMVEAGLSFRL